MNRIVEPGNSLAGRASGARPPTRLAVQPVLLVGEPATRLAPLLPLPQCARLAVTGRGRLDGRYGVRDEASRLQLPLSRVAEALRVAALNLPPSEPIGAATPLVIGGAALPEIGERLAQSGQPARVVVEPQARGSAAALSVAAHAARAAAAVGDDPLLVVLPAAHSLADENPLADETAFGEALGDALADALAEALAEAILHASRGAIVALGVPPRRASTAYGYIRTGIALGARGARAIERFVAQPDPELAERYVASGEYWWSSGAFVVRASTWLSAIALCRPVIAACCAQAFERATVDHVDALHLAREAFSMCASESIECAVLERIARDARLIGVSVPVVPTGVGHRAAHARQHAVVRGTALVTRAEERFALEPNRSTPLAYGVAHRLDKPGDTAQTGGGASDECERDASVQESACADDDARG